MTRKNSTTMFNELLLACMTKPAPILHLLEWRCAKLIEAEVDSKLSAVKWERTGSRSDYRNSYRARKWDTRMWTMYLLIPKLRNGGYVPFFLALRKRNEVALIQVVREAYINGVSISRGKAC